MNSKSFSQNVQTGHFMSTHAQGEIRRLPVLGFTAAKPDPVNRPVRTDPADHMVNQTQIRQRAEARIGFLNHLDIDIEDVGWTPGEKSAKRAFAIKQNTRHLRIKAGSRGGLPELPHFLRWQQPMWRDQVHDDFRPMQLNGIGPPNRWHGHLMFIIKPFDPHPGLATPGFE